MMQYTDNNHKKGGDVMKAATSNVNFKLDTDVKESMEDACKAMGLTLTAAFTIFAKKVGTERRIPFEVAAPVSEYARALHRDSATYRAGQLDTVSLEEMMARYGMENCFSTSPRDL